MSQLVWFDHKTKPISVELLSNVGKDDKCISVSEEHFLLLMPGDILYSKKNKGKREKVLILPNARPYDSVARNGGKGVVLMVGRGFADSPLLAYEAGDKFIVGGKAYAVGEEN